MSYASAAPTPHPSGGSGSSIVLHLQQLKIPQLKELCKSLRLSGAFKRKQELIDRISHFVGNVSSHDNAVDYLAIELLVMKLLNNDTIPPYSQLVQSMRQGVVDRQGVSNSIHQFRQAAGISRQTVPGSMHPNHGQYQGGYNAHIPFEDTYNGPMLLFRSTLLYTLRTSLGQAQVLRASKGRYAKQFTLSLSPNELQLLNSSNDMRVYIFSGVESTPDSSHAQIQFPPIEIYVNGILTKQFVKGIKGKAGTSRPADITPYITKDSKPSDVRIVYSDAAEKYILYPYIVEEFEPSLVVNRINTRPHIPAIHTKDKIKNENDAADDDDIQVATEFLSLRCPITYARIKYPFTSVECDHIQCFDGLSFLTMQQRIPSWQCPVCSKTFREDSLCVSDYIKEILDSTSDEVDTVKLEADGSWTIASDDDLNSENKKAEPEEKSTAASNNNAEENIEIISLDSDSDEELSVTEERQVETESAAENAPGLAQRQNTPPVDQNTPPVDQNTPPVDHNTPPVDQNTPQIDKNSHQMTEQHEISAQVDRNVPHMTQENQISTDANQNNDSAESALEDLAPNEGVTTETSEVRRTDSSHEATQSYSHNGVLSKVAPELHQNSINVDSASIQADSHDSDDDRVLATYRRVNRPKINTPPSANPVSESRPDTPDTNNTSDLTPYPESTEYMDVVEELPVSSAMGAEDITTNTVNATRDMDDDTDKHPESIQHSTSPESMEILAESASSYLPTNTSKEKNLPSQNTDVSEVIARSTSQSFGKEHHEANPSIPLQSSQKIVTENGKNNHDAKSQNETSQNETSQNESSATSNSRPLLSGNSIISTIQDQISRSVSPSLSSISTTAPATFASQKTVAPGDSTTNTSRLSQNSNYPQAVSQFGMSSNSRGQTWSSTTTVSDRPVENMPLHTKSSVQNVYALPHGHQFVNSQNGLSRVGSLKTPLHYHPGHGNSRPQLGAQHSHHVPNDPRYHPHMFNTQSDQVRGFGRSQSESHLSQAHQNFRAQMPIQEPSSRPTQNERILPTEYQDVAYSGRSNSNGQIAHHNHNFDASTRHALFKHYQPGQGNRRPPISYSQLIAMSSNMINAYNNASANNQRSMSRPPPLTRVASNIAKNTAFEGFHPRQTMGNEPLGNPITPELVQREHRNAVRCPGETPSTHVDNAQENIRSDGEQQLASPAESTTSTTGNGVPEVAKSPKSYNETNSVSNSVSTQASEKSPVMLKGLLGINISTQGLFPTQLKSAQASRNNSFSHEDTIQNSTTISLDNHIEDMMLHTPANRKRTIDETPGSSKRTSKPGKFNINDINSSDIIELESD